MSMKVQEFKKECSNQNGWSNSHEFSYHRLLCYAFQESFQLHFVEVSVIICKITAPLYGRKSVMRICV